MCIWQLFTYVRKSNTVDGAKEPMRSEHEKKTDLVHVYTKINTYVHGYIPKKNFKPHARAYQQVHGYRNTGCITHKYTGTHRTDGIHIICTGIQTKYTGAATRVVPILAHIGPLTHLSYQQLLHGQRPHTRQNKLVVHEHNTNKHNGAQAKLPKNLQQRLPRKLSARFQNDEE